MAAPRMTDREVLEQMARFERLHATSPTTHTDIMRTALRTEAKIRGLLR